MSRATACFSMVFAHVNADHVVLGVEERLASARASSVLPTPVGPRKMNEPMGRFGSLRPLRARMTASGHGLHGLVLADDAFVENLVEPQQFLFLPSMRRETGIPVQREMTSAISSAVTSSCKQACVTFVARGGFGFEVLQLFLNAGNFFRIDIRPRGGGRWRGAPSPFSVRASSSASRSFWMFVHDAFFQASHCA